MTTKTCPVCGKEFEQRSNDQKYCGEKCRRKANANIANSKKHNQSLPIGNKYKVYLAYDCKCALCGWQATEYLLANDMGLAFGYGNEIHHITRVGDGGNSDDGNVILLCPNCHKMAHLGIISIDELKRHTRPIHETCEQKVKEFWEKSDEAQILMDFIETENPRDELVREYVKVMQYVDLIVRAGYMKLNSIWRGWVDEIEDGARHHWMNEDEKD